jgi:hypothetical protein
MGVGFEVRKLVGTGVGFLEGGEIVGAGEGRDVGFGAISIGEALGETVVGLLDGKKVAGAGTVVVGETVEENDGVLDGGATVGTSVKGTSSIPVVGEVNDEGLRVSVADVGLKEGLGVTEIGIGGLREGTEERTDARGVGKGASVGLTAGEEVSSLLGVAMDGTVWVLNVGDTVAIVTGVALGNFAGLRLGASLSARRQEQVFWMNPGRNKQKEYDSCPLRPLS